MKKIILVFIIIFIGSCKKRVDDPPFTEENPVFYFKGQVNNIPVTLTAGENDYYMYSSYSQDTSGMYSFTGELKQINCAANCNSIFFKINDSRRSSKEGPSKIDSLLPGKYDYLKDTTIATNFIEFTSEPMFNNKATAFSWNFGDGTFSKLQNPIHSYVVPGNYNVCHTISYANGCENILCNEVKATSLGDCFAIIQSKSVGDTITFMALANGNSPRFYWNFGDTASSSNTSALQAPSHTFSRAGIYTVRLDVETIDSCRTTVFKNVITSNYSIGCFANFTYAKSFFPVPTHFSEITIIYKDKNNSIYKSSSITQPADSYFEVLSVDEYLVNENNSRTKKIHARFKCNVSDGTNIISITESDAVIAIAYP